jgi:hypothetical protein
VHGRRDTHDKAEVNINKLISFRRPFKLGKLDAALGSLSIKEAQGASHRGGDGSAAVALPMVVTLRGPMSFDRAFKQGG